MDRESVEEIKRHFGVVAEDLRGEIRLVAESLAGLREETRRGLEAGRKEFRDEVSELKALIRLSYGQLDQRLTSLETDVADLRSRLEKVESRLGH